MSALDSKLEDAKAKRATIQRQIQQLQRLLPIAVYAPLFSSWRDREKHFATGDRVMVYAYSPAFKNTRRQVFEQWIRGTVLGHWVVLDEPLLPSETKPITRGRATLTPSQSIWVTPWRSPFILKSEEFHDLASRSKDDLLRKLWLEDAERKWHLLDAITQTEVQPNMDRFGRRLRWKHVLHEVDPQNRLMGALEAAQELGFGKEIPASAQDVVQAFRSMVEIGADDETLLRRAKDTLLARIFGYREAEDFGLF